MRWALVAVLFVGCGGDSTGDGSSGDAFEGTYEVTSYTENASSCEGAGDAVEDGDAFFKLKLQSFFGQSVLNYVSCTDANTCEDEGEDEDTISLSAWSLSEKDGDVWTGESSAVGSSGDDGAPCSLNLTVTTAARDGEGVVTFEQKRQTGQVDPIDGKKCIDTHDELIEKHRATLPCTSAKKLVGKPVEAGE